jgi:hypothetical protein
MPQTSSVTASASEAIQSREEEAGLLGRAAPRNDGQSEEIGMTAYLILLALAGLIAIAIWEGFS